MHFVNFSHTFIYESSFQLKIKAYAIQKKTPQELFGLKEEQKKLNLYIGRLGRKVLVINRQNHI